MSEEIQVRKWPVRVLWIAVILLTLTSRIIVAVYLASDEPGDGLVYAQIARNILEQKTYSTDSASPFSPTLIRMPGYPLFLAGIYSLAGHENNTAVRITQALFDTATCILAAMLAFFWTADDERRHRNAFWAFVLAAICPFVVIYTGTILTETLTTFLMTAMALSATLTFNAVKKRNEVFWLCLSGLLAGIAVLIRPDAGLFAAAIGVTIVVSCLFFKKDQQIPFRGRLLRAFWKGSTFSLAFLLVLTPWTVRNYTVFGVFQPLSPAHGEMPGEFVPFGYQRWLRTWIDDSRFIEPMLWDLDEKPIKIDQIPAAIFDSADEREKVALLLDQYDHPPGSEAANSDESSSDNETADAGDSGSDDANSGDDGSDDGADADQSADDTVADSQDDDDDKKYDVRMTPEIDSAFAEIADQRIERWPLRYYLFLPAKRAAALWFDSHSLYYPFGGQMSPVKDLDHDENQQYWLPGFTLLMWIYTLLGIGGVVALWRGRIKWETHRWLLFAFLMFVPRIAFFSTIENPEPRYVVELFVFAAIFGGIFLGGLRPKPEAEEWPPPRGLLKERLVSLDVFRGATIAAMTLVNAPGSWKAIYPQLAHAEWNGATFADAVFPAFLFIVGISITLSLGSRADRGGSFRGVYLKIVKRTVLLFLIGIALGIFPFYDIWTGAWFEPSTMRIMGILQRIAICYFVVSLIFLHSTWNQQLTIAAVILVGYTVLMSWASVPGCAEASILDSSCNLASYIDRSILGPNHIWRETSVFDPEGLLSTLPAIATTLAGLLAGQWLRSGRGIRQKMGGMIAGGSVLAAAGYILSFWIPLNKSLWSSSFVIFEGGLSLAFFGLCFWLIDVKGYKTWTTPFAILGSNAIALYVGSSLMGSALNVIQVPGPNDSTFSLQETIFNGVFALLAAPVNASLLYAVGFVLVWLFLMWLLYRKEIFIKI